MSKRAAVSAGVLACLLAVAGCPMPGVGGSAPEWGYDYESALTEALDDGKRLVLDFHSEACGSCRLMDMLSWSAEAVVQRSADFVMVRIDVSARPDLVAACNVTSTPTIILLTPSAEEIDRAGFLGAEDLLSFLDGAGSSR